jgi:nitrogen fixation-related uncharacterized protein
MFNWLKNLDSEDKKVVYIYGTLGIVFVISLILITLFEMGVFQKVNVPENFVVYAWLGMGVLIIVALVVAFRWALKTNQFDEDTKYQMFSEEDDARFLRAHLEHEAKMAAKEAEKAKKQSESDKK